MKLPNAEDAIVEISTLTGYCLNPAHFRGRNKARIFHSTLQLIVDNAVELQLALLQAAREQNAKEVGSDMYGTRYVVDFEMTRNGRTAAIRSFWILPENKPPRWLTCYVL